MTTHSSIYRSKSDMYKHENLLLNKFHRPRRSHPWTSADVIPIPTALQLFKNCNFFSIDLLGFDFGIFSNFIILSDSLISPLSWLWAFSFFQVIIIQRALNQEQWTRFKNLQQSLVAKSTPLWINAYICTIRGQCITSCDSSAKTGKLVKHFSEKKTKAKG